MLSTRSFIDVLFILLLSSIVMLSQSVRLGAVDTAPAELGGGGISRVRADEVRVIVVGDETLILDDGTPVEITALADRLEPGTPVLLVTAEAGVSHHRVLSVWSSLRARGLDVMLGARPAPPERSGGS